MTDYAMDLWQEVISISRPNEPHRHTLKHNCAAPEIEFGEFPSDLAPEPPPPDFLDHIVLVKPGETYEEDHFVANYIGRRGTAHMAGNLYLRWNTEGDRAKRTRRLAEIRMRT